MKSSSRVRGFMPFTWPRSSTVVMAGFPAGKAGVVLTLLGIMRRPLTSRLGVGRRSPAAECGGRSRAVVVDHLTVYRIAAGLGVSWHTANSAVLAEGKRRLIDDPHRFKGVSAIGVDEHVWRHTRRGDKYVTVIIDLTPIREKTGPARLLDMVEGRSKQVFKNWLADRPRACGTGSKWSRWTGSPASKPRPARSSRTLSR